mmetsp:Transcript_10729/g.10618  ORF Transcript_10729/g.10618 Transcript_10729/m.10618 type:complete len:179 (-) Transcript_10729:11-547(-)
MLKFQRNNVIDSSSSGTSDEGKMNIVNLLKSTDNPKHSKLVNSKIQKAISDMRTKQLEEVDERIISGIVKKRFSDSDVEESKSDSPPGDQELVEIKEASNEPKRISTGVPLIERNSLEDPSSHGSRLQDRNRRMPKNPYLSSDFVYGDRSPPDMEGSLNDQQIHGGGLKKSKYSYISS